MKRLTPIFLLLLASCELVVDVDVPYGKDKVVVNAIQRPDSLWRVVLTRSKFILDPSPNSFYPIDDATVVIENPDGTTETLSRTAMGEFRGNTYPQAGQTYKITVTPTNTFGLDGVAGEMSMPYVVPIIDVEWDSTGIDPDDPFLYYQNVDFKLTFNDPPGVDNYYDIQLITYHIVTYQVGPDRETVTDTLARQRPVTIHDAGIADEEERRSRFNDHTFEGRTYTAHLSTQFVETPGDPIQRIELRLMSQSKELFQYDETKELSNEVMGDPFAQPVPVYSNLSNGFGIFAGSAPDIRIYTRQPKAPE
jgi:hypothetical protein